MASNSILKLQVDDKQYEASLKSAQQGLQALQNALQNSGKSFAQVDKAVVDYAKSIGQMSAQATSARGKIGEMTSSFTELSLKYRQLTEEEKKSPFGQALSASLDQLRTRTVNAKRELEELNNELSTTQKGGQGGGLFSGDKLSGMLQVAGGNLLAKGVGMAASALNNLTSQISECVTQGIELAKQGEGIRNAFERLGRGDLLAGLREATHGTVTDLELMKAAVKFDDFKLNLDELGTMLAFAQQKAKDTGQSVDYMVDSIVTGLGRKSLMILDNLGLSATEIRERMKETGDMTKAVGAIIREQMAKSGEYIETAADRAAQANVSLQNKMEELGRKFAPVEEASTQLWTSMKIAILDVVSGPLTRLLNGLTEAGRLRNTLNDMNATGSDGQTHTGRVLGALRHYSGDKQGLYNRQVARYNELENQEWQRYNQLRARQAQLRQQYGSQAGGGLDKEMEAARNRALAWQQMRSDYQKGARSILNPAAGSTGGAGGDGGTGGGKNKGGRTTKQEIEAVAGSIDAQAKKVQELQKAWRAAADDDSRQKIKKQIEEAQFELDKLEGKTSGIPQMNYGLGDLAGKQGSGMFQDPLFKQTSYDASNEFSSAIAHQQWKLSDDAIAAVAETFKAQAEQGKKEIDISERLSKTLSGVSTILSGIEQIGFDVPKEVKEVINVIQGLMSIVQGVQTVVSVFATTSQTANTTAVTALTAAVTANTAALAANSIASAIPFAGGGVVHAANGYVGGNHYSGDLVPAFLNSGELVLNRVQQGVLASELNNSNGPMQLEAVITGEQLRLVLNNNGRRTGRGEIITTKFS